MLKKIKERLVVMFLATDMTLISIAPGIQSVYASSKSENYIDSYYEYNQGISLSKNLTYEKDFIEEVFRVIETTPDNQLENMSEEQLINYFNTKTEKIEFRAEDSKNSITPYGWWENTKCGAAILAVVGGTVFAGAKLLKLKKYIKDLGGAKEAAYLVYLYFYYGELPKEGAKNLGKFVLNLAEMILGIDTIKSQCGDLISESKDRVEYILC